MSSARYQEQFQDFYNQYQAMVYALCLGYMKGGKDLAKDLTQEVFIQVWRALPKFRQEASPKTWIYRICVNTCLLHIRNNKKFDMQSLDDRHDNLVHQSEPSDKYEELHHAIGRLNDVDRIVIMLVLDEMKYDEIAEVTGIKEGNLRVKIHRIKQKLNELMDNHG
ncbi:sigma-70 family RNA polymerase sigma factor [Fulvivirga ulvae]|uniref:RNA polymerase sigma factor n=1 Tax=Fulvivirga ulvae TaxID=2904245 RepID=UPI001F28ABB3|nr:sigma-70 family RNA polymerase sigma factor [Fulvivirga ulvae]UII33850.1 sigma-70 family RNA polymerase sigma factor [Fulvivirga ulvae]